MSAFLQVSLNAPHKFLVAVVAVTEEDAHRYEWLLHGDLTVLRTDPELADLRQRLRALGASNVFVSHGSQFLAASSESSSSSLRHQ
jgi:hypothetical protein